MADPTRTSPPGARGPVRHGYPSADPAASAAKPPEGSGPRPASSTGRLAGDVRRGRDALRRMWLYERRALGLVAFDTTLGVALHGLVMLAAATLAVCATLLVIVGLRAGVAEATSEAWWGDVLLAVGFGVFLAAVAAVYRRQVHRSTLREARREGQALGASAVEGATTP